MADPHTAISWSFPEYERGHRRGGWFVAASLLGMGLCALAIASGNFLFASIIIFIAAVYALQHYRHPLIVDFTIAPDGITLQGRTRPWKEIQTFWMIYEPPEVKNLYFSFKGMRPRLKIPLHDQNPLEVREALLPYLEEDLEQENEPMSDAVGRMLKL
ncbi:hypothetical protein A3B36_02445 [Candidatus Uhrbacteria bacterium RIFCSPLOWO2_01_FULL_55_36]|uniref:DUF5673 domain-containing protein n=1 Tax=Candidatus Uhrbacteria bacterium RIFCSPLOWO2_01_FULL_55_36 TaxID=1802404 RepID=A0A1F7V6X8_9BACT|nr:MAG: hypothetical protein A3B36_02445 [Candidatus Uhrbacteria bacterium RIFCSPLOWO2_01_FULL_55_36]